MKQKRPVNLNLFTIRLPVPALVSILHRVSGIILFLLLPFVIWTLSESLGSVSSFDALSACLRECGVIRLIIWLMLSALAYHLVAGVRHLVMDLGVCESLACARAASYVVLIISAVLIVSLGAWLW